MIDGGAGKRTDLEALQAEALRILGEAPHPMDEKELRGFVRRFTRKARIFRELAAKHGSPLYIVDETALKINIARFGDAFSVLPFDTGIYYAVKSNNMPEIARIVAGEGIGLDVSSGRELEMALSAGARKIVFSGPGKTDAELAYAARNSDRVTVLIDSFGELDRLDGITRDVMIPVKAGVRLTTVEEGLWRKFGIPLARLEEFVLRAGPAPLVQLEGIQFHTSWNLSADAQTSFLSRLGPVIAQLPAPLRKQIRFIDIGGGYWPEQGEWLRAGGTASGSLRNILSPDKPDTRSRYMLESSPVEEFAQAIAGALEKYLPGLAGCRVFMEPGRWLCHDSMHLLMTVVDIKPPDIAITDAGTNAVGWERFEHDFFPVINVSDPAVQENPFNIFGSLCTPHDVWGYSYHGKSIDRGDLLLIPTQGAYTYSLRQEFIKELPKTVVTSLD